MLLSENLEDQRLFDVLTKSYSDARYAPTFSVSEEDANGIYKRVSAFLSLTKVMCKDKIDQLVIEASTYRELHRGQKTINHQAADVLI